MDDTRASSPRDVSLNITLEGRGSFSASGPDDLVFTALAQFLEEIRTASGPPRTSPRKQEEQPAAEPDQTPAAEVPTGILPLKPFYEQKTPKSNPETVAVIAAWSKWKNGEESFTADSLEELWRKVPRKLPKNMGRDITGAASEGWIESAGEGSFRIHAYGERFVEQLPERRGK